MQDNKQNTVSIYEVKELDANNQVLDIKTVSEAELIHNIVNRNDLRQPVTEEDIVNLISDMKSKEEELGQPVSFFLFNKQNTQCDVCTFIEEAQLH